MTYAILRFKKHKAGSVATCDRHNERKKQSYKSNPDIDMERTKDNYHLVKPPGKYADAYRQMVKEAGCKLRKDSVVLVETLITASSEFMLGLSKEKQREFFVHALDFISREVGKQNTVSAVVHMDEKTPHMHLSFCPITADGRLCAKEIIGNSKRLEKWQDDYHAHMSAKYPELERGIPASVTGRKHIPVTLYKQAQKLETAHDEIVHAIGNIGMFNAGKKRDEALAVLEKYIPVMTKFTAQLGRTDDYLKELERNEAQMQAAISQKNAKIQEMDDIMFGMRHEIRELNRKQQKMKELLDQVPPEIMEWYQPRKRRERSR